MWPSRWHQAGREVSGRASRAVAVLNQPTAHLPTLPLQPPYLYMCSVLGIIVALATGEASHSVTSNNNSPVPEGSYQARRHARTTAAVGVDFPRLPPSCRPPGTGNGSPIPVFAVTRHAAYARAGFAYSWQPFSHRTGRGWEARAGYSRVDMRSML